MATIPLWKVRREIWRVFRQIGCLFYNPVKDIVFRYKYDFFTSRAIRSSKGLLEFGSEVAIYLIYPERGVLGSHLHMLEAMVAAGITPVVISNLRIPECDLPALRERCAQIIERPNVGYDFGGYREGVIGIAERLPSLKRLWLFNDSAWYVPKATNWFDVARQCGADFVGASSTLTRGRLELFRQVQSYWAYEKTDKLFHYGSFALSIGSRILSDPRFLKFWRKLKITDDKTLTVMRGEIGLTQWVLKCGFTHASTSDLDDLDLVLKDMELAELRMLAKSVLLLDEGTHYELKQTVCTMEPGDPDERELLSSFILFSVAQLGFVYALADYAMSERGLQFLKKSPHRLNANSSIYMRQLIEKISGAIRDHIRAEL